ncbi:hypothetical protein [Paractinoplanes rishiriensis]|uniref:Uncharacterized protein n=1 Tax=Paractinoplanes rishiriensis TaxID=1050105 RepID=A0A919MZA9_9ACTN|nr:hypothetical protein [Actinoplanes rishiriensis]GIF01005.1 hypothetical protein Ari01nite_84690 [Actinoplanes rishiriensis]
MSANHYVRRPLIVAAAALAFTAVTLTAASAASNYEQCTAGGDTLDTTVYYDSNGSYWFVESNSFTLNENSQDKNNVYMRLRNNGGANTYFAWTSGDNIVGENTYQIPVNENVPKSGGPYMKTNAIFDQSGGDPNCSTYANL